MNMRILLTFIFLSTSGLFCMAQDDLDINKLIQPVDSGNIFINKDAFTWGASVINGEDGLYHMFYSRWMHGHRPLTDDSLNYIFDGFSGWNKYSEIAYAVSENASGPYRHVGVVLKGTGDPTRWDRYTYHNPLIRKFDGWYYLYFISNSFDSGYTLNRSVSPQFLHRMKYNCSQKVGVIKARTIQELVEGNYEKPIPCLMAPDNKNTFEVATNPTVTKGPDGRYYMMYKSRRPNIGHMTFWMATSDKPDGPYTTVASVLNTPEMACEDPSIWYDEARKRFYATAKYYSNSGKLVKQFGALVLITSEDGLNWEPAKNPLVSNRQLLFKDGSTVALAHLERPFILTDEKGKPLVLFGAASVKNPAEGDIDVVTAPYNTFNVQIPLKRL